MRGTSRTVTWAPGGIQAYLLCRKGWFCLYEMSDVVRRVYGVDVVSWRNTGSNLSLPPSQDPIACCLRHGGTGGHDRMEQNSASFGMRKLALLHSVVVKFPVADAIKNILVLN